MFQLSSLFMRLSRMVDPFAVGVTPQPAAYVWAFIFQNQKPFSRIIGISLLLTLFSALLEVWLIGYAGRMVDSLASTTPALVWQAHKIEFMIVIGLVLIVRPLLALMRETINDVIFKPSAVSLMRWRLHKYIVQQSVGWFQNGMAGSIAAHVRDAGSSAAGAAYELIQTLAYVAIYIVGSIWLMASIDVRLIWPLLIWLVIYFGLMAFAVPKFEQKSAQFQSAYAALLGFLVDAYANIALLKIFSNVEYEDVESQQKFEATRAKFVDLQIVEVMINIGLIFISSLLIVGMVGYSVVLWHVGAAGLGLIATSIALGFRISSMAEWLMDSVSSLYGCLGSLAEQLKTVAQPLAITDAPDAAKLNFKGGAIEFKSIFHHYGGEFGGLNGVSLSIKAGEKVGLVGQSGAGKSTLVHLLLRFHELEQGQILIDGQDIGKIKQNSLRQQIGLVMQDAALWHRSIADNIGYGRANVTQQEIENATKQANAHEFICQLQDEQGHKAYDVQVGERGVKLSGGQRQRVALARLILKNAPILILDEATSALDSETELAIQHSLYEVMQGKTVIAIAHRLSTIAQMDRIIVLDEGCIIEQGTHEQLLEFRGKYAHLWALQSGGYMGH